ncbi:HD domain-containing protein [Candidatus Micrarchaeota archaeon]|nr:HD domain-containing protein [Candidatus Micrarchaeota archaeon]
MAIKTIPKNKAPNSGSTALNAQDFQQYSQQKTVTLEDILSEFKKLKLPQKTTNAFTIAYGIAEKVHKTQKRDTGDPYITHPLKVSLNLLRFGFTDSVLLSAAVLHDVLEEGPRNGYPVKNLESEILNKLKPVLGNKAEVVLENVKRLSNNYYSYGEGINAEVLPVKLCDILHNSSSLQELISQNPKKVKKGITKYSLFLERFKELAFQDPKTKAICDQIFIELEKAKNISP